jgi:hypothetical protein
MLKEGNAALIRNEKITIQNLFRVCYTASPVRYIRQLITNIQWCTYIHIGFLYFIKVSEDSIVCAFTQLIHEYV